VYRGNQAGKLLGCMSYVTDLYVCGWQQRAGELVNVLNEADQVVPPELMKFGTHVKKKESKLYGAHFKDVDMNAKATKTTFGDDSD
jgi:hypothetical protein